MERSKFTLKRFLAKTLALVVAGIFISSVAMASVDTYSWFFARADDGMAFNAATTADIIDHYEIAGMDLNGYDPTQIKVQRAADLKYSPTVYFEVTGEAAKYIEHINPVVLGSDQEVTIPIKASLHNIWQVIGMGFCGQVEGTITLKYLNNYISEPRDIKFTGKYLIDQFFACAKENKKDKKDSIAASDQGNPQEVDKNISDMMAYLAQQRAWEPVQWTKTEDNAAEDTGKPEMAARMMALEQAGDSAANGGAITVETVDMPISELQISDEQGKLIDLVVPKLREYIGDLYSSAQDLTKQLNEKIQELAVLDAKITQMTKENLALNDENTQLKGQVDELQKANDSLTQQVSSLEARSRELMDQNAALADTIDQLRQQLDAAQQAGGSGGVAPVAGDSSGGIVAGGDATAPPATDDTGNRTTLPGDATTPPTPGNDGITTPAGNGGGDTIPIAGDSSGATSTDDGATSPTAGDDGSGTVPSGDTTTPPAAGDNGTGTTVETGGNGDTAPTAGDSSGATPTGDVATPPSSGDTGSGVAQPAPSGDSSSSTPAAGDSGNSQDNSGTSNGDSGNTSGNSPPTGTPGGDVAPASGGSSTSTESNGESSSRKR